MTGFANVQTQFDNNELICEIRSLNSRYLEISVKLPKPLIDLENHIRDLIRQHITRGKVFCNINFTSLSSELQNLKINPGTVQIYKNLLEQIKNAANLDTTISLDHLLFFKDIISFEEEILIDEELNQKIKKTVLKALQLFNRMREEEGENLTKDIQIRLDKINALTNEISEYAHQNPRIEFEKLYKRLLSLIEEEKTNKERLEQELAIISDRVDITEEVVRMKSHLQLFQENLAKGSPIGKKLNFILQEMHRETNTMSNKSTMVEISHRVVAIKEEIEKLREQIQNIE